MCVCVLTRCACKGDVCPCKAACKGSFVCEWYDGCVVCGCLCVSVLAKYEHKITFSTTYNIFVTLNLKILMFTTKVRRSVRTKKSHRKFVPPCWPVPGPSVVLTEK